MSHLKKIDHVTYAVESGAIERWAWFHIEVEGGKLIKRIDDARQGDSNSSMKIWCIDYGDFGIALIEGIDRAEKSQVTSFVEKHGDHACQHVAYDCHDLDGFVEHMKSMGGHPRGGRAGSGRWFRYPQADVRQGIRVGACRRSHVSRVLSAAGKCERSPARGDHVFESGRRRILPPGSGRHRRGRYRTVLRLQPDAPRLESSGRATQGRTGDVSEVGLRPKSRPLLKSA